MKRPGRTQTVTGVLRLTRGRFRRLVVLSPDGRETEVAARTGGVPAFPGDTVKVELGTPDWAFRHRRRRGGMPTEARIVEVVKRGRGTMLGTYQTNGKRAWVVPKDKDVIPPIEIEMKEGVAEGSLIAVDIGKHPGIVTGKVAAVWKDPTAARSIIEQLVWERDLPREFPPEVIKEADAYTGKIPRDELAGRTDLRGLTVVVIDPKDAKDHDDAVSWEPKPEGGGRLGVHIADVSWYVRPGSALDEEARTRGVSCYLTDRVLPMLPPRLSADLCSLLAGQDRLARTAFIDYNAAGDPVGGEIVASVIRPTVSLSYEEAWVIMQDPASAHPQAQALHQMHEFSALLRRRRIENGSLDFAFPETRVMLGPDGEPSEIVQRRGDPSHWLVEEFMIAANRFTGEALARAGLGIWRIHEPPDMEDVAELEEFLKGFGVKLRRGGKSRDLEPKDFQAVLLKFKGQREEYVVHRKVLQALRLAVYSAENVGHFGLAIKTYTHFTSPIRRYADLIVHRLLNPDGPQGRYPARALAEMAAQTSELERRAQEAEWACTKKMVLRYLQRHLGDTFDGTVSRLEKWGAFVELDGIGADGLVRLEEVSADRFQLSPDGMTLRGRRTGLTMKVGQRVRVVIARISEADGHLDLVPADD